MPRRGYVYMVLFSLFISISGTIKYRVYIKRDFNQVIYQHLVLQTLFIFLLSVIPGLLLVRWYYKMKDK